MTNNPYSNGNGHSSTTDAASALGASLDEADIHHGFAHPLEEPVQIKGFAVTYDRMFNLGNFESLNSAIHVWVKSVCAGLNCSVR